MTMKENIITDKILGEIIFLSESERDKCKSQNTVSDRKTAKKLNLENKY